MRLPRSVQTLDRRLRARRRAAACHRRQTESHCAHVVFMPARFRYRPIKREIKFREGRSHRPGIDPPCSNRMTKRSSTRIRRWPVRRRARIRDMVMRMVIPRWHQSFNHEGSFPASSLNPTIIPFPACASRLMRPSIPATSGGPSRGWATNESPRVQPSCSADNIGYIIPTRKSSCFSRTLRTAIITGSRPCSIDCKRWENPALREFLKLDKSVEGKWCINPTAPTRRIR